MPSPPREVARRVLEIEAAAVAGVVAQLDGAFLEIHPDTDSALSGRETQLDPARVERLQASLLASRAALRPAQV